MRESILLGCLLCLSSPARAARVQPAEVSAPGAPLPAGPFLRELDFQLGSIESLGLPAPARGLSQEQARALLGLARVEFAPSCAEAGVLAARSLLLRDLGAPSRKLPRDVELIESLGARGEALAGRLRVLGDGLRATDPERRKDLSRRLAALRGNLLEPGDSVRRADSALDARLAGLFDGSRRFEEAGEPVKREPWSRVGPGEEWALGRLHAMMGDFKLNAFEFVPGSMVRGREWSNARLDRALQLAREDAVHGTRRGAPDPEAGRLAVDFIDAAREVVSAAPPTDSVLGRLVSAGTLHGMVAMLHAFETLLERVGDGGEPRYAQIRSLLKNLIIPMGMSPGER